MGDTEAESHADIDRTDGVDAPWNVCGSAAAAVRALRCQIAGERAGDIRPRAHFERLGADERRGGGHPVDLGDKALNHDGAAEGIEDPVEGKHRPLWHVVAPGMLTVGVCEHERYGLRALEPAHGIAVPRAFAGNGGPLRRTVPKIHGNRQSFATSPRPAPIPSNKLR